MHHDLVVKSLGDHIYRPSSACRLTLALFVAATAMVGSANAQTNPGGSNLNLSGPGWQQHIGPAPGGGTVNSLTFDRPKVDRSGGVSAEDRKYYRKVFSKCIVGKTLFEESDKCIIDPEKRMKLSSRKGRSYTDPANGMQKIYWTDTMVDDRGNTIVIEYKNDAFSSFEIK